jgi:hypothetical protein
MRRKRFKMENNILNEGVYDYYIAYDPTDKSSTADKIVNYYLDKIAKSGRDSLTKQEQEIFNDAKRGILSYDKPVYKRNKLTNDIEMDSKGKPIRIDSNTLLPGVPFITSRGKGAIKKEIINGRCYWNIDENFKTFYVFGEISETNQNGLTIWKTVSSSGKEFGAFLVPKSEASLNPDGLWKVLDDKFDKGIILNKETYSQFIEFDQLYHLSKKQNLERITELYNILRKYPSN